MGDNDQIEFDENSADLEKSEDMDQVNNDLEGNDPEPIEEAVPEEREFTNEEFEALLKKERRKGARRGVLFTLLVVAVIAIIGITALLYAIGKSGVSVSNESIINEEFATKADRLWAMIDGRFLWEEDVDAKAARDLMYKGMLESLNDPYSVYYTEEEFGDLIESNSGEYSGIGAYVTQDTETREVYISRPMPGSPAEEAGLKANDYVYTIDGEDVTGQDLNVVVSKIKGPEGSTVDIGIRHENKGDIDVITVERRKIEVAMLESEMLEDNIGYIWVYEFEEKSLPQFETAYAKLKDEGMEGLIVDLRDNPGGDLDIVCKMADIFLDEGVIVYTKDRNGGGDTLKSDAKCEKIPMVIITNGNSASASEIFTGSLKDRGVAVVVGQNTFGKGIVQGLYSLPDGTGVKFTESEYYLPNDECIHGVGIAPDYEVELDYEAYYKDGTDAQKDKAIEVMKGLLK